jgi:serine/threonine protein kinase/beta-lactam-binding protein with PASTA domain
MPLISDSIGRVLGKRYRLLSALGTGASAHVFLAEDVTLQRHVAVKVLQPGLSSDEAFLKRFGAEARSVASLNHPHVLRVFDWGEDTDGPYLVLEYLGGGSLRDLLDRGVRLTHSQAAHLGAEVAQGLAYAHGRGLVHRDIKPANLLFDEEGLVRVADFGVARALAEAAYTEPAGAMVGTARYMSPESAEGKPVDGKADVYSLALVLYEALSGTVPFVTDTTIGTLAARVGQPLPPNEALGPLDDVLARAAAPQASARLDAAGFAARLGALASALPTPEPLALHPPEHEPLAPVNGFRPPAVSELTQVPPSVTKSGAKPAPVGTKAGPGEIFDAEPGSARARAEADGSDGASGANGLVIAVRRKSRKKMFWIIGVLVLVLALAAAAVVAVHDKVFTPSHPVPILAGLPLEKARAAATKDHFTLHVENGEKSITVGNGVIIRQSPKAGKVLKQGATLSVVPSIGPPAVAVPSLTGMNCTQAAAALVTAHLKGLCIAGQFSDTVTNGLVISWSYDGAQNPQSAAYGSTIQIIPSLGHGPVPVPTSISQTDTYQDALVLLQAAGLNGTEAYAPNISGVPPGDVISLYPPSGTSVPYGSTVKVTISTGPPTTTVSNVLGDTVPQATTTLQDDGLTVSGVQGNPTGTVIGTNPPTGTTVQTGSSVQILAQ